MHRSGRHAEAERIYRNILRIDPDNADALHLLGLIAQQARQPEEAVRLIRKAIANNPMVPSYWSNLAKVYEQGGDYPECERAARKALDLDPRSAAALHCLANALRADDRYEEAAEHYREAVELVGDDAALWANYGSTLLTIQRYDEAVTAYRRALALSPGQAEMYSNLGNAFAALGRIDDTIGAYREALRVDPGFAAAYTNLAGVLLENGETAEATSVLRSCLEVDPGNTKALAFLAAAAHELGDDETRRSLMDFEDLIAVHQCEAPTAFESLEAFNATLVEHVMNHGSLAWERTSKTTRKGRQTGELLDREPGPVAALESLITAAVESYIAQLPDQEHPFVRAAPGEWTLTIWATVLGREGHQDAHIHPTGWLSGVYYAAAPAAEAAAHERSGWIEFGRAPDSFRTSRNADVRMYEPKPGLMLLFPSYFHHRTVPFGGDEPRVSIAFDVMPTGRRSAAVDKTASLSTDEVQAELGRARAIFEAGDSAQAQPLLERLAKAAPETAEVHQLLGMILFRRGLIADAAASLRRTVELAPENAGHRVDLGSCLVSLGESESAVEQLERAAALDPRDIDALMRLAMVHAEQGCTDLAASAYERVIERDATAGGAHYGLAMVKQFEDGDERVDRMRHVLDRYTLSAQSEATISLALGRGLDQLDRVDEAMAYYGRGNRAKRRLVPYDIAEERSNIARIIEAFPASLFESRAAAGERTKRPVFVVGMPRAGTTLVEQILDSHPRIHGAGEINDLWRIVSGIGEWLPRGSRLPEDVARVGAEAWTELGRRYLRRIGMLDADADRIIDKLPFNYTMIGIIHLMLPDAGIVHCVRDPRDTCMSCYVTSFSSDRGFTSDLSELGETYQLYWRLMQHWHKVLPGRIYDVHYERLVDDVERETRGLLEHLGLEWSAECLEYHRNPRPIATASMTQVRQPAYRTSIGRWRRYEAHLAPLFAALGDLEQYGIDDE